MRKVVIKFGEGNRFKSLNEERNFFYQEAVRIIDDLETRNSSGATKEVIVYVAEDNVLNVVDLFIYEFGNGNFADELREVLLSVLSAEEFNAMIEQEEKLFEEESFRLFVERYDLAFCGENQKPFPFMMELEKLYRFYELAKESVGHLFYSKLPSAINIIGDLLKVIVDIIDIDGVESNLEKDFYEFLDDEKNFGMIGNYIPSRLDSLSPDRIPALYPNYKPYQGMQSKLFNKLPYYLSFDELYQFHLEMLNEFELEFNRQLFNGVVFKEDFDFENVVLKVVINRYEEYLKERVRVLVEKEGLDEGELYEAINLH